MKIMAKRLTAVIVSSRNRNDARPYSGGTAMALVIVAIQVLLVLLPNAGLAQSRGHLGVFIQNAPRAPEGSEKPVREGVMILGLIRKGPAEQGGLQRGDIILKFNEQPVRHVEDLQRLVSEAPLGETAEIEIFRRDQALVVPVKIEPTSASMPLGPPPNALPVLLQRDELFWIVLAAAGFSVIIVYLGIGPAMATLATEASGVSHGAGKSYASVELSRLLDGGWTPHTGPVLVQSDPD